FLELTIGTISQNKRKKKKKERKASAKIERGVLLVIRFPSPLLYCVHPPTKFSAMSALQYLESQRNAQPELAEWYNSLADLYQKKLWHQLTSKLEQFVALAVFQAGDALIQLYHNFITDFETKINLLKLAHFAVVVSRQYQEKEAAISYLNGVIEKLRETREQRIEEPILYIKMQIAMFKLEQGDQKESKKLLDDGKSTLDSMTDIDPSVYASYYWVACQYHKYRQEFADFYRSALLYLAYTSVESLSDSFKLDLAFDLSLSALLGDNIYNFGELLAHPIIKSLSGTQVEWLYYILQAFNSGDLTRYQELWHVHESALKSQPALVENDKKLLEKINILCLMEIIFSRPSEDRTIPLKAIAERTNLSIEEVEHLLMKSLSVHLIEGIIDQVEGTVHVSWVQPRVLGIPQIKSLRDRLDGWLESHTKAAPPENQLNGDSAAVDSAAGEQLTTNPARKLREHYGSVKVASAPGKVLLTGGYLILERPNSGIVLSTSARFYAIVKPIDDQLKPDSWAWSWSDVKLTSPQLNRSSSYKLNLKHLILQPVSSRQVESRNPFVEHAIEYVVAAANATLDGTKKDALNKLLLQGLDITILGANDFYSYRNQIEARGLPLTPESLAALSPFMSITFNADDASGQNCKPEVAKTGLGSSAAMTTAVVAALLKYFGLVDLSSSSNGDLDLVHIIAQSAHCIAQGKVGSGFDVSSAVYGSHRYVRFSPFVLSSAQDAARGVPLQEVIVDIIKGNWDHERTKFCLPPLMTLLLGEPGSGGSSTPSMVGAVKKWQKADPQKSDETWKRLSASNLALETQLKALSKLAEEYWSSYKSVIDRCSLTKTEKWAEQAADLNQEAVVRALLTSRDTMLEIRKLMWQMGEAAGVPIEPESQTKLLDSTMNMEGVLLAGVPGAGGFDAVFAVTLGSSGNNVAAAWSSFNVLALLVREDPSGVRIEHNDPRSHEISSRVSTMSIN
ncbi:Phosphomevalonate kinase, peroxisomal, partial [Linum perenne]